MACILVWLVNGFFNNAFNKGNKINNMNGNTIMPGINHIVTLKITKKSESNNNESYNLREGSLPAWPAGSLGDVPGDCCLRTIL